MIKQLKTIIDALNEIVIQLESKPDPAQETMPISEKPKSKPKAKKEAEKVETFASQPEALDESDLIMPDQKEPVVTIQSVVERLKKMRDTQGVKFVADFLSRFEIKSVKEINDSHLIEMDKFLKEVCKC